MSILPHPPAPPPPESRPPLHSSANPPIWTLTLRALIRTASGKGGGRNTETEATMRVWHEGLQKLRLFIFIYAVIDDDEVDN